MTKCTIWWVIRTSSWELTLNFSLRFITSLTFWGCQLSTSYGGYFLGFLAVSSMNWSHQRRLPAGAILKCSIILCILLTVSWGNFNLWYIILSVCLEFKWMTTCFTRLSLHGVVWNNISSFLYLTCVLVLNILCVHTLITRKGLSMR